MNTSKFIFLFLFSVVLPKQLISQVEFAQWKTIHTGINVAYYCATEDTAGNIWFGTGEGLVKYDGINFVKVESPSFITTSILADKTGKIWFGTYDGLSVYDGTKSEKIENEYIPHRLIIEKIALDKDGSI